MFRPIAAALAALLPATAALAAPVENSGNGHFYEYVVGHMSWTDALNAAAASTYNGLAGYLTTVTSAQEQAFIQSIVGTPGNSGNVFWLGGTDAGHEGTWTWEAGPEQGQVFYTAGACTQFCNWESGEPNNSSGTENWLSAGIWWNHHYTWNDMAQTGAYGTYPHGYLVEYSATPVPLPAGMPLLLAGVGGLSLLRRRRKAA